MVILRSFQRFSLQSTGAKLDTHPIQFEKDYITDAKDRAAKRQVVDMIRRKYPGISKDDRDNSREYRDFINVIRRSKGAVTGDEEPTTVSDLDMSM